MCCSLPSLYPALPSRRTARAEEARRCFSCMVALPTHQCPKPHFCTVSELRNTFHDEHSLAFRRPVVNVPAVCCHGCPREHSCKQGRALITMRAFRGSLTQSCQQAGAGGLAMSRELHSTTRSLHACADTAVTQVRHERMTPTSRALRRISRIGSSQRVA